MRMTTISRKFAGAIAALALCAGSTAAVAASSQHNARPAGVSPLVALSALGSDASRAALCGASAVAAAGAAAVAQGAAPGCVLPIMDAPPPPPQVVDTLPPPPVPPPPVAPVGGGFGISPLLLALGAIAAAVLLVTLLGKKDKDEVSPA